MCGTAGSGEEAIKMAMDLRPDVIVMDINMPGMDGVAAASEIISQRLPTTPDHHDERPRRGGEPAPGDARGRARVPRQAVLRRRVRDRASRPSTSASLRASVQIAATLPAQAARAGHDGEDIEDHQVIAVFSPKGGAGRTTIATNLALALQPGRRGRRVCLVDANLQFGDVGVLLNLNPKNRSDRWTRWRAASPMATSSTRSSSTTRRASASCWRPPSPEGADLVTPAVPAEDHGPPADRPRLRGRGPAVRPERPLPGGDGRGRHHPRALRAGDHDHQERPPVPGGCRPARVRPRQDPAGHQPRRLRRRAFALATWRHPSAGPSTAPSSRTGVSRFSR